MKVISKILNVNRSFLVCLVLFQVFFIISCSKNNEHIFHTNVKQIIEINSSDLLIINLGNFGDEEGASILCSPKNARESKLLRQVNSGATYYHYSPIYHFSGLDSVTFLLDKGSDGANPSVGDTTKIQIIVR